MALRSLWNKIRACSILIRNDRVLLDLLQYFLENCHFYSFKPNFHVEKKLHNYHNNVCLWQKSIVIEFWSIFPFSHPKRMYIYIEEGRLQRKKKKKRENIFCFFCSSDRSFWMSTSCHGWIRIGIPFWKDHSYIWICWNHL